MASDRRTKGVRAVVFAYHDVGVRALETLLARGYDIPLVITHRDDPQESVWFQSVEACARRYGIDVATPVQTQLPDLSARIAALEPDFLFSFYYRYMIPPAMLKLASRGALNLHGSLLPRYRGRAPVNWAVLAGDSETGASLHDMVDKPDAGNLLGQETVPILRNDTAAEVMNKLTVCAERLLWRMAPLLARGAVTRVPQNLAAGNYCGRRYPEDGRVDWRRGAWEVHNLVRAVAPPYPGAFTDTAHGRLWLLRSHFQAQPARYPRPSLYAENGRLYVDCADGRRFELLESTLDERPLAAGSLPAAVADGTLLLGAH